MHQFRLKGDESVFGVAPDNGPFVSARSALEQDRLSPQFAVFDQAPQDLWDIESLDLQRDLLELKTRKDNQDASSSHTATTGIFAQVATRALPPLAFASIPVAAFGQSLPFSNSQIYLSNSARAEPTLFLADRGASLSSVKTNGLNELLPLAVRLTSIDQTQGVQDASETTVLLKSYLSDFFSTQDGTALNAATAQAVQLEGVETLLPQPLLNDVFNLLDQIMNRINQGSTSLASAASQSVDVLQALYGNLDFVLGTRDNPLSPILEPLGLDAATSSLRSFLPEQSPAELPSFENPINGTTLADLNTGTVSLESDSVSLLASLARQGDPSDANPDQNDVYGQVELKAGDLIVGANFQNGVYAGPYVPETLEQEGHHAFQTGMVDQSGTYFNGERTDLTNPLSLAPELDNGEIGLGDLLPFELSINDLVSAQKAGEEASPVDAGHQGISSQSSNLDFANPIENLPG